MIPPSRQWFFLLVWSCGWLGRVCRGSGWIDVESRHQDSLSHFDPTGKLLQVEYAIEAASLGTPVVAVCRPGIGLFMASPQVLPSPFILDDGTSRFARITSDLLVAHSGIAADGRVLVAACQELAIQHEYVYDEPIPLEAFLQDTSLLFQEYTMKPMTRPFGTTLVVAHQAQYDDSQNCFYRIDPSGSVECLGTHAVINGDKLQSDTILLQQVEEIAKNGEISSMPELDAKVVAALIDALKRSSTEESQSGKLPSNVRRILTASMTRDEGMVLNRHDLS